MRDPRFTLGLVLLEGGLLLALVGWWLGGSAAERLARLETIRVVEQMATFPPTTLAAQAVWLGTHRLACLQGMTGLALVAGTIGLVEGWACRHRDPLGGLRVARWTLGRGLTVSTLMSGAGYLILPWPLPPVAAGTLALLVGSALFLLAAGRPLLH